MEPHIRDALRNVPQPDGAAPAEGDDRSPLSAPRDGAARRAFRLALLLLPIGVLGNLAYTLLATERALLAAIGDLPRAYLLAALALTLVPWLTGTLRLMVWSRFLRYRIPFRDLFRMTLVVDLGAAVSPTAIGGEAFRWGMLVRRGVKPGSAAMLALIPKIEDAVFFFAFALPFSLLWTRAWRTPALASGARLLSANALTVIGAGIAIGFVTWLFMKVVLGGGAGRRVRAAASRRWRPVRRRLRRTRREATLAFGLVLRRGKARFALTLVLTTIHWGARYSVLSVLALFIGVPFDPVLFWLLQWVVFTFMSFVPTPGAAGGAEVAFTAVYAPLLPSGVIGLATAAWRFFTFYVPAGLAALVFSLTADRTSASR